MTGPVGDEFTEAVLDIVASIPRGRVMTYGDIAATLGSLAARRVGTIMARHGSSVPWWRVIRASGEPPSCHENAAVDLLRAEGTPFSARSSGTRIDLAKARHRV